MHDDLAKLLSLGKINTELAETLDQISPGSYCYHNSWGTGKVKSWSLPAKKIVVDFENKSDHEVALGAALQILTFLSEEHFLVKRYENLDTLVVQAKVDPIGLIRDMLTAYGNSMKPEEIEAVLKGTVVGDAFWKNWWDKVRSELRSKVEFMMPTKKGEKITLREGDISYTQAGLEDYQATRDLKAKIRILDGLKTDKLAANAQLLLKLVEAIDEDVRNGGSVALQQVLELAVLRDDYIAALNVPELAQEVYPLSELVKDAYEANDERFAEVVNLMPASRQKSIYEVLKTLNGDAWVKVMLHLLNLAGARATGEVAKFIVENGHSKELINHLKQGLRRQTLSPETLIWMCRQRNEVVKPAFSMGVGIAMMSLIEQDHTDGGPRKMLRLRNMIMDDKTLIDDMIGKEDLSEVRQFAKVIYNAAAFTEQERGALMARMIKLFPALHEIVLSSVSKVSKKQDPLYVSWASLDARKKELDELVNVKIPENLHNKKISRAEGDLRENGGYQDAKEVEKVLNRRRKELEQALASARGTDFEITDTEKVVMGTKVTLEAQDGTVSEYTILGAWDTNPEKHIVSYLSQLAKQLLGRKVGDQVKFVPMDGDKKQTFTILKIEAAV